MSAITRPNSLTGEGASREDLGRPAAAPVSAHPSWRFHDRFELWVDWMQKAGGTWAPLQNVLHRSFKTREDTLLHAERVIGRGEFPLKAGAGAPVTLLRNRREALLRAFREAEGDGVTLIRELVYPVGEYALSVKITRERAAQEVRSTFGHAASPLRSLAGRQVKLTVLIEHPYDVLSREGGVLELGERAARVGAEPHEFAPGAPVTGVPYRHATVQVSRGLTKKPLLYRYELSEGGED